MKEYRVIGPPGCGKTSFLATEAVPGAIKKFGRDKVMVLSFTRAGAREIATKRSLKTGKRIEIDDRMVGTIHSICFHALGAPKIAEVNFIDQWNIANPQWAINKKSGNMDDYDGTDPKQNEGNKKLNKYNIARNRVAPIPQNIKAFAKAWEEFKQDTGCVDFTGLLEQTIEEVPIAPGNPDVIFVDEAQDSTALQLKLIRRWGYEARWIVLVGDPDQAIYRFAGAEPKAFMEPTISDKHKKILGQSYRVPRLVVNQAMKLIGKIKTREPVVYNPRIDPKTGQVVEGSFESTKFNYKQGKYIVEEASEYLQQDKSVMILTSCSYMLKPVIAELKKRGIPFANPYRTTRGDWNPLNGGNGTSSTELLLNFLEMGLDQPYWNVNQLVTWASHIKTGPGGLIRKQGKIGLKALAQAVENNEPGIHTTRNVIDQILTKEAIERALARDTAWLFDILKSSRQTSIDYPLKVFRENGKDSLEAPPGCIIGTVHSVKGGQADVVILAPDISLNAYNDVISSDDGLYSAYRLFYVGMTRAKEKLIIMKPTSKSHFVQMVDFKDYN